MRRTRSYARDQWCRRGSTGDHDPLLKQLRETYAELCQGPVVPSRADLFRTLFPGLRSRSTVLLDQAKGHGVLNSAESMGRAIATCRVGPTNAETNTLTLARNRLQH